MRRALGIYSRNDSGLSKRLSDPSKPGSSPSGVHSVISATLCASFISIFELLLHTGAGSMADDVAPGTLVCVLMLYFENCKAAPASCVLL